jgi:hypothetical protein
MTHVHCCEDRSVCAALERLLDHHENTCRVSRGPGAECVVRDEARDALRAAIGDWGEHGDKPGERGSGMSEPFDEAQAWADEAARNGDPELYGDVPPRSATPEPRPSAADRLANAAAMLLHWTSHPEDPAYRHWLPASRADLERELAAYLAVARAVLSLDLRAALERLDHGDEGEGCRWCSFSEGHDAACPVADLHAALAAASVELSVA